VTDSPAHDELPLPDYDHIPLGTLPMRITALDEAGIGQLLAFERAHGNRPPGLQVLERRLEALQGGAEPTGTIPDSLPEGRQGHHGTPANPATAGPPMNPPSHGDPTNPAQPR